MNDPKRGPPTRTGAVATKMLRVRLTTQEWALLEAVAAADGKTMSDYVRSKVLPKKRR